MYLLHNRAINHIQHFWQMKKKEFSQTKFEATTHHHHFVHMQKKQMEESQILKSNCKTDIILMHHNKKLVSMIFDSTNNFTFHLLISIYIIHIFLACIILFIYCINHCTIIAHKFIYSINNN